MSNPDLFGAPDMLASAKDDAAPVPANKLSRERKREIFRKAAASAVRAVAASLNAEAQAAQAEPAQAPQAAPAILTHDAEPADPAVMLALNAALAPKAEPQASADSLPPLPTYSDAESALRAILAAYYDDAKPIHAHGFRIVRADLADAIEAARIFLQR